VNLAEHIVRLPEERLASVAGNLSLVNENKATFMEDLKAMGINWIGAKRVANDCSW